MMSWLEVPHRGTRDLDLLGLATLNLRRCSHILALNDDDGVEFDVDALHVDRIREEFECGGLRLRITASISGARINLAIDIGFGDAMEPGVAMFDYLPVRWKSLCRHGRASCCTAFFRPPLAMTNTRCYL